MPRRWLTWLGEGARWLGRTTVAAFEAAQARRANRRRPAGPLREMWRAIPFWVRGVMLLVLGLVVGISAAVFARYYLPPAPSQPIPFSHRFHVSSRKLSCFLCHPSAMRAANAGVPAVEKCMLCHLEIIPNFPPIRKLRGYYFGSKPVPWVRVNRIPDYVHFSHQPHIARGFDCSKCHGNVKAMDRVGQAYRLDMNFCVTCHWRSKGPDSCFTCHY